MRARTHTCASFQKSLCVVFCIAGVYVYMYVRVRAHPLLSYSFHCDTPLARTVGVVRTRAQHIRIPHTPLNYSTTYTFGNECRRRGHHPTATRIPREDRPHPQMRIPHRPSGFCFKRSANNKTDDQRHRLSMTSLRTRNAKSSAAKVRTTQRATLKRLLLLLRQRKVV